MTVAALSFVRPDPFAHLGRVRSLEWLEAHSVVWDRSSDILPTIIMGVYRRMSTLGQATGYRQQSMIDDMTGVVLAQGPAFGVIVFDEGNKSGQIFTKRKVAVAMIRALNEGDIDGIATPDAKRLSRDQYLGGGREIVQAVRKRKAMLILGRGDIVNLRNYRERKQFERDLREASDEIGEIRQTMYSGWAARARQVVEGKVEPMWRGPAPYGYHHVDCLDEHGEVIRNRGVARRTLAKFDEDAAGIARLIELLGTQRTLNAVAVILNREGYGRRVHKGAYSKGWTGDRIAGLLDNPVFYGVWRAIREKTSDLWDDFDEADLRKDVPDLAYWTEQQARDWQAKFIDRQVQQRQRVHDRPFVNLLLCSGCNAPMISAGYHGYRCRRATPQRQGIVTGMCRNPQTLSAASADKALRGLFIENIGQMAERIVAEHQRQQAEVATDPVAEELALLDQQEDNLLALTRGSTMSPKAAASYAWIQKRRAELQDEQAQRQTRVRLSDEQVALVAELQHDAGGVYDDITAAGQAGEVWRLLGVQVRVRHLGGRGATARYSAVIVTPKSLSDDSIWIISGYLTQAQSSTVA